MILVVMSFLGGKKDRLDVPRDKFSIVNTTSINKVRLDQAGAVKELRYENNLWVVNNNLKADPQRVTVLFSILKQVKVRKKVAKIEQAKVDSLLKTSGVKTQFYSGDQLVQEFTVAGDEKRSVTYISDGNESYIVQIPGYNVYIANIFKLDENGWRDPLAINMDWINLSSVQMVYPEKSDEEFTVKFIDRNFIIEGIQTPDSLKVTNFLDDVSRLYVNDYLFDNELSAYQSSLGKKQATVVVSDVGQRSYTIEIFDKVDNKQILARIDSSDYVLFDYGRVRKILKPKSFFQTKRPSQ